MCCCQRHLPTHNVIVLETLSDHVVPKSTVVLVLQPDCSVFATSTYARARTALGPEHVQLLSPGSLFLKVRGTSAACCSFTRSFRCGIWHMCSASAASQVVPCMHASIDSLLAAQGPSSVNLPITDLTTNQTVGNVTTVFRSALTICVTDTLAPGALPAVVIARGYKHLTGLLPASTHVVTSLHVYLQAMLGCVAPSAVTAAPAATQQ